MECRRDLNQSLQKGLLRFSALQPDTLPVLVCREEFLASVAAKSVGERSEIPFKFHSLRARCGLLRSQSHIFIFFRILLIGIQFFGRPKPNPRFGTFAYPTPLSSRAYDTSPWSPPYQCVACNSKMTPLAATAR
jgi:hypothetical protein